MVASARIVIVVYIFGCRATCTAQQDNATGASFFDEFFAANKEPTTDGPDNNLTEGELSGPTSAPSSWLEGVVAAVSDLSGPTSAPTKWWEGIGAAVSVDTDVVQDETNNNINTIAPQLPSDVPNMMAPTYSPTEGLVLTSAPTRLSNVDYFEDGPNLKWTIQLPPTGFGGGENNNNSIVIPQLTSGTALRVSPDGLAVYVTTNDGSLHVLSASNGSLRWSHTPVPLSFVEGGDGTSMTTSQTSTVGCESGVYFGETRDGRQFAVWAVIDTPPAQSARASQDFKSRIIAVSHPNNRVLWTSESIDGKVQGSPIVTQTHPGEYIFFTHNQMNATTGEEYGAFSMISAADGSLLFTEIAGESQWDPELNELSRVETLRLPYSPIGVSHSPTYGRYPGGLTNTNDLFLWSTSADSGSSNNGYTRAFQLPRLFEAAFAPGLATSFLKENRWNAIAPPALSVDGMDAVFGITGNGVRGWTSVEDFDQLAFLTQNLGANPEDFQKPVPFQPTLALNEPRLFVVPTTPSLFCLSGETGEILWTASEDSPLSAKVIAAPDDALVFATRVDGVVSAYNQQTGNKLWSVACADLVNNGNDALTNCVDVIEAESSLSPNGLVFFYGDKYGNVKALQLGTSNLPTIAPTGFPTGSATLAPTVTPVAPTSFPTVLPTLLPPTSEAPTSGPSPQPSMLQTTVVDDVVNSIAQGDEEGSTENGTEGSIGEEETKEEQEEQSGGSRRESWVFLLLVLGMTVIFL